MNGVPQPEIVGMSISIKKMTVFVYIWAMGFFIGMGFEFVVVRFRVRCGAPQVRSLREYRVSLYRRTPLMARGVVKRWRRVLLYGKRRGGV